MKGDFLDAIYDCLFKMHELVKDEDISKAIFSLKDVQKEFLYQLAIKGYSCQLIAAFREQIFYDTYRTLITDKKNKQTKEITNTI